MEEVLREALLVQHKDSFTKPSRWETIRSTLEIWIPLSPTQCFFKHLSRYSHRSMKQRSFAIQSHVSLKDMDSSSLAIRKNQSVLYRRCRVDKF